MTFVVFSGSLFHFIFFVSLTAGPHVKIMSQTEVEAMTAQKQQQMKVDQSAATTNNDDKSNTNGNSATAADANNTENAVQNGDKVAVTDDTTKSQQQQSQPTNQQQQQQQHPQQNQMHHYNGPPPHFGGQQYGMPPPGYGGYPPGPWGMPWQHPPQQQQMSEQPAKNLIVKPGVIEPQVIARAAEWSEHRAPDGRPYYYHAGRGESVWEKPQAIRDLEGK